MTLPGGTPPRQQYVAELGGQRYAVLQPEDGSGIGGVRTWEVMRIPAQEIDESPEHQMQLQSWHEGAGFSYAGMQNTYERANGWDASAPGRLATWARHATGESLTSVNYRGWCKFYQGRLYVFRGRYVYWYAIDTTHGNTWQRTLSLDLGSDDLVISGEPAEFDGRLYVPVADATDGSDQPFRQLPTIGTPDSWETAPSGLTARTFKTWHNQKTGHPLLVRATGNRVYTVDQDPMEVADWGGEIPVGDPAYIITQLATWRDSLMVIKENGLFSVDEIERATNELPDLESSVDRFNGVGTGYSNAALFIPHKAGLIRWTPNAYVFVGPQAEGALEADISPGWGRVQHVTPFGKWAFLSVADALNNRGSIYGLEPAQGERGPLTPHLFHMTEEGWFEGMCVVQDQADIRSYLAVLRVADNGTDAEPWVYQLPRNDYSPGSDPTIVKTLQEASFHTPRYWQPGREIQKSWRCVEFWLEASPTSSGTPGLEVWATIDDDDDPFPLLGEDNDPAEFRTRGFKQAWFPPTAHGSYVQLEFRVPGSAQVDAAYVIRDVVLRLDVEPLMTDVIATSLVMGQGEHIDGTSGRMTPWAQLEHLRALANPQVEAVAIKDPWGRRFHGKVMIKREREAVFKGHSTANWVVDVEIRRRNFASTP